MQEAVEIGEGLRARGWRLAVAESCTGGLLGYQITRVPGASDYFVGGVIAYADEIKRQLLGVSEATLLREGAVSEAVAAQMAEGVRALTGAEVALSVTGIAGPGGGTAEKPVGLTFVGLATPEGTRVRRYLWEGDREANQRASVRAALHRLLEAL
ncbi:MAG: CinA family protein [Anaerolineales bacterium]